MTMSGNDTRPKWVRPQIVSGKEAELISFLSPGVYNTNTVHSLNRLLIWDQTPQGHDYWRSRYYGDTKLSKEDILFIKKSYRIFNKEDFNDDEWE